MNNKFTVEYEREAIITDTVDYSQIELFSDYHAFYSPESNFVLASLVNEFDPFLTMDGSALYFASDRPGGAGLNDLYVSAKDGAGDFSDPGLDDVTLTAFVEE